MSTRENHTAEEVEVLLSSQFKAGWGKRTPVKWDNRPHPECLEQEEYWVAFMVEFGDSHISAVGGCKEYRQVGRVIIDFNIRKNTGPGMFTKAYGVCNKIFRGENIFGIRMGTPLVSPEIGDDSYYRKVVSYPFNFDDK